MDKIFSAILEMSVRGGIIAVIIIILRLFIKRLPKKYSYSLWLILALRLICPFSFSSPLSLFNVVTLPENEYNAEYSYNSSAASSLPDYTSVIEATPAAPAAPTAPAVINTNPNSVDKEQVVAFILSLVWVLGVIIITAINIVSYAKLRRRISSAIHLKENIYRCHNIDTPFVCGIIKPRIYIPQCVDEKDMPYILAHEKTHISRGDHIIKALAAAILTIHWFNPLILLSYKLMVSDMELSCDEKAILSFEGDVRKSYANALLNISMAQNKISLGGVLSFGDSNVKDRIKGVLSFKKPKLAAAVIAAAIIIIAGISLLTNAQKDMPKTKEYNSFALVTDTAERQCTPEDISELLSALDAMALEEASEFVPETEAAAVIRLYKSDNCRGEYSLIELHDLNDSYYLAFTKDAGITSDYPLESKLYDSKPQLFSVSSQDYHSADSEFVINSYHIFTGIVTQHTESSPSYVIEADDGFWISGPVFIHSEETLDIGDRIRVCFQRLVMETSPQQINQVWCERVGSVNHQFTSGTYISSENPQWKLIVTADQNIPKFEFFSDGNCLLDIYSADIDDTGRIVKSGDDRTGSVITLLDDGSIEVKNGYANALHIPELFYRYTEDESSDKALTPEAAIEKYLKHTYGETAEVLDVKIGQGDNNRISKNYLSPSSSEKYDNIIDAITTFSADPLDVNSATTVMVVARTQNGFKVIEQITYAPDEFSGTVREVIDELSSELTTYYMVQSHNDGKEYCVYQDKLYGNIPDYAVGDRVKVTYNYALSEGRGNVNQIWAMELIPMSSDDMTSHYITTVTTEPVDYGFMFTDEGKDAAVSFELPSQWELSGSTADCNGLKCFELGAVFPADAEIDYDKAFKTDIAHGYDITVHNESFGTQENSLYRYMIHDSVPDKYSPNGIYECYTYIVQSGGYCVILSFPVNEYYSEESCSRVLRSIKISPLFSAEYDGIKLLVNYDADSNIAIVSIENHSNKKYTAVLSNEITRYINGEYVPVGLITQVPEPIETVDIDMGKTYTYHHMLGNMDNFQSGHYRIMIQGYFSGEEPQDLFCDFEITQ